MSAANKLQELIDIKQEIHAALEAKTGSTVSKNMHDWAQIIEEIQTGESYSFEDGILTLSNTDEVNYNGQKVKSIIINNNTVWIDPQQVSETN